MRVALVLLLASLVVPAVGASAWPTPQSPAYEVTVVHPYWGPGIGRMWGHPSQGVFMDLELVFGRGYWAFSIGGTHSEITIPTGEGMVVDRWTRTGGDRFVGGYPIDADGNAVGPAWGEGRLSDFVITVYGHT